MLTRKDTFPGSRYQRSAIGYQQTPRNKGLS